MDKGKLFLVPTPIGNLEDITIRSINTLKEVDCILAEDTRTTGKLLKHYEIQNKLKSYHIHNEHQSIEYLVSELQQGKTIAMVSDAGTPAISDPGFLLVRACRKEGIEVECLPGATAFVPALVKSGLPSDSFVFEGFLPHKKGRKTKLLQLVEEKKTVILYESPHRLLKALNEFKFYFTENREISVSREISKMFEETVNGTAEELIAHFEQKKVKGEFVIVIEGSK